MASQSKSHPLRVIILLCGFISLGLYISYFTDLPDQIKNLNFTPSHEVSKLIENINFTNHGVTIFKASRPALSTREEFNTNCQSHDDTVSILGCFTQGKIYIYQIDTKTSGLDGILESVSAHEMLHAVWSRLHSWEKSTLETSLLEAYAQNEDLLAKEMSIYGQDYYLEELHSRLGTEVKQLPDTLESHYAKYFKDQDALVDYYLKYKTPFQQLEHEAKNLNHALESLSQKINQDTKKYYQDLENLNIRIEAFNNCVNRSDCFTSGHAALNERRKLLSEQLDLDYANTLLNEEIAKYNNIVNQYNSNVLHTKTLENIINSNAPSTKTLE